MFLNKLHIIPLLLILSSCDLIDYHPYDGRLSSSTNTDINNKSIKRIEASCKDKDIIRFIMIGDTQRSLDETEDFVEFVNKRNDADFIIHGGDIADFGMKKEYEWTDEILSKLNIPYVAIIGNHDIIGNGDYVYKKMYGDENFSFIAGNTKFVCLNTNAIEFDYSHPVPDFGYIEKELKDERQYSQTIVAMHAPPGSEQFDNNVKTVFHMYIKEFPSLLFCLHAHNHNTSVNDLFGDGILYYGCSNMAKRSYLYYTLTPDGYTYEVIEF
ncbi:metallophosphoesterase family protein [Parabacteroides bouchesdurhonensis]|uniref:metallophosphoesterase family protein n=1 Tax=Parabacteroides bouchesdurhonensis TaxID=1936995 RepID=UPI000C816B82|nr:metallophosphoesterase [Parabacteroides bouchesdurhonensis]RHJ90510.1 metallophosphoesterase [Bacteroides sp. AM07-16]